MKPINTSCVLILGVLTLFSISNANAGGCNFRTEKKAEIECLSDDKKCIDTKEKESLYKVDAQMFDNLGTALVQALVFFAVFGFFVYQNLFADSKPKISKLNPKKKRFLTRNNQLKNNLKKAYLKENLNLLKRIYQSKKRDYLGEKKKLLKKRLNQRKKVGLNR